MKRAALLTILLGALAALILGISLKDTPAASAPEFDTEFVIVRAYYEDPALVQQVAIWQEPWLVDRQAGYIVLSTTPTEYAWLESLGFRLEIDEKQTALYTQPRDKLPGQTAGIPGYECYRTVEETFASAEAMVAAHPTLVSWVDAGDSWEKITPGGAAGYDIMVLRLTNAAVPDPKPKLMISTGVHAREYMPPELSMRFAEYLLDNYSLDADVTWLLDHHEIHLMVMVNPDGRKHAEELVLWRKNTNENYCGATSNSRGADINRNFAFQWGCCSGSSGSQCSETFRGPSPASEPETQALQNYGRSIFPDQRADPLTSAAPITATGVFLDIHSSGNLVLWPWGFTDAPAPNSTALQTLGRKLAYFNGYEPDQSISLYPADGTTEEFGYGELGLATYTIETGTSFFQSCQYFEDIMLPDNLPVLLYAAKVARTPYMTPAGPDTLDIAFNQNPIAPDDTVTLNAAINDTRYNNGNGTEPTQNIAAAEYYIDVPPWISSPTPVPHPLSATDGSFNNPVESVTSAIDTTSLGNGRHTIFIRGQDANGNWGPFSSAFLYVIDPAVAATIEGYVTAADTGLPLEATISAGQYFAVQSDPLTGYYEMHVISGTYDLTATPADSSYGAKTAENISVHDGQTVQQDFSLYPLCTLFGDDVESGIQGWSADSPWAVTEESSHSPSHSWTDSPGANYSNNLDISLVSPSLDFTDYGDITLDWWQICDTEAGYDYCQVEISTDGGATWKTLTTYDGIHTTWEEISLDLLEAEGQSDFRFRFRLVTDFSVIDDGWHVDDIEVVGAGPSCIAETQPAAAFQSSSPDFLGETTAFVSTSTGGNLSYQWDFGDGSSLSSESNPIHKYTASGIYTVTLIVSNTIGSDAATGQVEITPSHDVYLPLVPTEVVAHFANRP